MKRIFFATTSTFAVAALSLMTAFMAAYGFFLTYLRDFAPDQAFWSRVHEALLLPRSAAGGLHA